MSENDPNGSMIAFVHRSTDADDPDRLRRALAWALAHGVSRAVVAAPAGTVPTPDSELPTVAVIVPPVASKDLAGGLIESRAALDAGAVVVIDAGAPIGFDLRALVAEHHLSPAVVTLALVPPDLAPQGALRADVDRSGRVLALVAPALAEPGLPAVDGCLVLESGLLEHFADRTRPLDIWDDFVPAVLAGGGLVFGYVVAPASAVRA